MLNSRVLFWFLLRTSNLFHGGWITCTKQYFGELPIREIDPSVAEDRAHHDAIVELARRIVAAKASCASSDTSAHEREIDERVYSLYGLNNEQIRMIEQGAEPSGSTPPAAPCPPIDIGPFE